MKEDLTGGRYGRLVVLEKMTERLYKEEAYRCRCDCGNETTATKSQLKGGKKKSCSCLRKESPANVIDLAGRKFGMLTVLSRAGRTKQDNAVWLCRCDCGEEVSISSTILRRGEATSCGCQRTVQMEQAREILLKEKTIDGVSVPLLTKKVRSDSGTGHKGIYRRERNGKVQYEANITIKGKRMFKGPFDRIEDAIAARKQMEAEYHKPYIEALEDNHD